METVVQEYFATAKGFLLEFYVCRPFMTQSVFTGKDVEIKKSLLQTPICLNHDSEMKKTHARIQFQLFPSLRMHEI
jgi:hypothetical protein